MKKTGRMIRGFRLLVLFGFLIFSYISIISCSGKNCDNCQGVKTYYIDRDEDGYGDPDLDYSVRAVEQPEGYVDNNGDCDDFNDAIHPGAREFCNNYIDENCDGRDEYCDKTYYLDADGDGYGDSENPLQSIIIPDGYVDNDDDCDDSDDSIHPGAIEICEDEIDQDCSGSDLSCSGGDTWVALLEETDEGVDGTIDAVVEYVYDANAKLIEIKDDSDNDGSLNESYRFFYNENGLLAQREDEIDGDGVVDGLLSCDYYYDGKVKEVLIDFNGDFIVDVAINFYYMGDVIEEYDYGYDGTVDLNQLLSISENADGFWAQIETDTGINGSIEKARYFTYDDEGNMTREEWVENGVTVRVIEQEFNYDSAEFINPYFLINDYGSGNPYLKKYKFPSVIREDENGNGVFDGKTTYVFNATGYPIEEHHDDDNNGTTDAITYITWGQR